MIIIRAGERVIAELPDEPDLEITRDGEYVLGLAVDPDGSLDIGHVPDGSGWTSLVRVPPSRST